MTRQILARQDGIEGKILSRLEQSDDVWEAAYDVVMAWPKIRRLRAFWRHYYGAGAEMRFDGPALSELSEELRDVLRAGDPLPPPARAFLEQLAQLCELAMRAGARIEVIAD